tara:strand:+ start:105 stop:494 length:390 start_codon:yes stop_codon:yes gene_type:complete
MILKIKIAWAWLKKYWKAAALVIWTVLIWLFSRKNADGAIQALKASKESSEKQINELKKQHHVEIEKRKQLRLKYDETIATIEEKYKRKEKDLSIKEKKKVKEILQKAKDNPDEINKKIEDLFGFTSDS